MKFLALAGLLLAAGLAPAAEKVPLEYSLGIAGELVIDPQGKVKTYAMDDGLAQPLASLVQRNVEQWTFEPIVVDGKPVTAKTRMRLGLLAQPRGDDYELRVEYVYFGDAKPRGKSVPPRYPRPALLAGVQARVVVMAKVDAEGNVLDAHAYQSSVSVKRSEQRWRKAFAEASVAAALASKYEPTDEIAGRRVGNTLTLPFTYTISQGSSKKELEANNKYWRAYIPGPVSPPPWIGETAAGLDTDALADGQSAALDSPFRLKTDVIGKVL